MNPSLADRDCEGPYTSFSYLLRAMEVGCGSVDSFHVALVEVRDSFVYDYHPQIEMTGGTLHVKLDTASDSQGLQRAPVV